MYSSPAESGHASSLGLGQALLGVDDPHREELGQQLLRHLYPELVAGVQGLRRKAAREEAQWADKFTDYILLHIAGAWYRRMSSEARGKRRRCL